MSIASNLLPSYTYSDYKEWKGEWELIEGIPYSMAPSPSIKHQSIGTKIITLLENSIENCTDVLCFMSKIGKSVKQLLLSRMWFWSVMN